MYKGLRLGTLTAVLGMAVLTHTGPAHAGNGVGAGLVGFGIGAVLGSMLTPSEVYYGPPPPPDDYGYYGYDYGPADYGPDYYYGPDYGPPPPPRPHRRVSMPTHRDANQSHAMPASSASPAQATSLTPAPKADAKFKAAQAKAKREGVENLTQEDIAGLSSAQLKQLRGY
jgi:hypothetical protein